MSGVVGWIDYSRDLGRYRPLIAALTATLAQRGPDGETMWLSDRAALGVRTLLTDPSVGERQPYVLEAGDSVVVACVVGAPVGLGELRRRLSAKGSGVAYEATAPDIVARAYREFGVDFVPDLGGSFALAIWDGRSEELFLVRDQVGSQPLFFTQTPTGLVFASERKTILAHPEVSTVVDAAGLRSAISHALPTGPLYLGLSQVDGAEILRFGRNGIQRRKYWQLTTSPHTDDAATTVATVRAMLEASVRASLPADASSVIATLSGGIDSSAVAGLAAAELRRRGPGRLSTFTIDFVETDFQPDVMRDTRDEPYARAVAEFIDSAHTVVRLEPTDILDPVVRLGVLRAKDVPTRIYDMDASQYLFIQSAATLGRRVALTGGAGDQLFQGARWSTDKTLVEADTFPWLAMAQRHGAVNGFGTGLLSRDVLAALELPTYYRDSYATAAAEVAYLPDEDHWQRQMRRVSYLVLTRGPLDSSVYAAAGLQMRAPINTHPLIQYAYNIPAEMHHRDGIEKSILRAAVGDVLPRQVLQRRQSATPVSKHPGYAQRLQEEFKAVLADPQAPVRALIDLDAATELVNQPVRMAKNRLARADVELALQLNLWLDQYRVRLVI